MSKGKQVPVTPVTCAVLAAVLAMGATATFTPIGPTTVSPGTPVTFEVTVSVESLSGFDAADIVIGSNDAADIGFAYSTAWEKAFLNVTSPFPDVGFYAQDVFVGGNNPTPVGSSIVLGEVSVATEGMTEGTYTVRIDAGIAHDVSSLILDLVHEDLQGAGAFTIACAPVDPQCDVDVDLADYRMLAPCITGPGQTPSSTCSRYDTDDDGDVDLADIKEFAERFTGPF